MSVYRVPGGAPPPEPCPDEAGAVAELRRSVRAVRLGVLLPVLLASFVTSLPGVWRSYPVSLWVVISPLVPIPPGLALYQVAMLFVRVRWRRAARSEYHLNASSIRSLARMYGGGRAP